LPFRHCGGWGWVGGWVGGEYGVECFIAVVRYHLSELDWVCGLVPIAV